MKYSIGQAEARLFEGEEIIVFAEYQNDQRYWLVKVYIVKKGTKPPLSWSGQKYVCSSAFEGRNNNNADDAEIIRCTEERTGWKFARKRYLGIIEFCKP